MSTRFEVNYAVDETECVGYLALPKGHAEMIPGVLVVHTWFGRNRFAEEQAEWIAKLGYAGFAVDLYGNGKVAGSEEEAAELMAPLYKDRGLLRKRIQGAYEALLSQKGIDKARIGVVGFCLGGLTSLELYRSGSNIKAAVSVHGAFREEKPEAILRTPLAENISGSLLILTGALDPLATLDDLARVQRELSSKALDWQTHIFANAAHSFTNRDADRPESGFCYNRLAAERSFASIEHFFKEKFK